MWLWRHFSAAMRTLERTRVRAGSFVVLFLALIIVRLAQQWWIDGFTPDTFHGEFVTLAESVTVFLTAALALMLFWSRVLRVSLRRVAPVVLAGLTVILIAPIFDIFRDGTDVTYYEMTDVRGLLTAFVTVFGQTPHTGITIGYRVEMVVAVVASVLYAMTRTRSWWRVALVGVGTYGIFFFIGAFPSIITALVFLVRGDIAAMTHVDVATLFFSTQPVLMHTMPSVVHALLFHVSVIYVLIGTALGGVMVWRHAPATWRALRAALGGALVAVGMGVVGGAFAGVLRGVAWHTVESDAVFVIAAALVLVLALLAAALAAALDEQVLRATPRLRTLQVLLWCAAVFVALIVMEKAALLLVVAAALDVLRRTPPLQRRPLRVIADGVVVLMTFLFALYGAAVIASDIAMISNGRTAVFLLLLSTMVVAQRRLLPRATAGAMAPRRARAAALGVVIFAFFTSGAVVFNLAAAVPWVLLVAAAAFGVVWNSVVRRRIASVTAARVLMGMVWCFVAVLWQVLLHG